MSNTLVTIKHDAKQIVNDAVFGTAILYGVYQFNLDRQFSKLTGIAPYGAFNQALLGATLFAGVNFAQREAIKMKFPVHVL